MEINTYRHNLSTITEWPETTLRIAAQDLQLQARHNKIPRQREEADRLLGHVAFEMFQREYSD